MTMAKLDDPGPSDGMEFPPSPRPPKLNERKASSQRLSLGHLMIALIYFALVFWAGRQVLVGNSPIPLAFLFLLIGSGICVVGLWAVIKFSRYSFLGWGIFVVG